jgi:hypothetical protein
LLYLGIDARVDVGAGRPARAILRLA